MTWNGDTFVIVGVDVGGFISCLHTRTARRYVHADVHASDRDHRT